MGNMINQGLFINGKPHGLIKDSGGKNLLYINGVVQPWYHEKYYLIYFIVLLLITFILVKFYRYAGFLFSIWIIVWSMFLLPIGKSMWNGFINIKNK